MLFIFGTKRISKVIQSGNFYCPRCGAERPYQLMENRKYFSLFFIPIIPLEKLADTLDCNFCRTSYVPQSILSDSEYTASTLSNVGAVGQLASLGKRVGSYMIDMIFLFLLNFPIAELSQYAKDYFPKNFILVFLPIWALYFFLMEWLLKGTIGKKICGIRIVSDGEEQSVSVFQYLIRSLIKMIPVINIILLFNNKHKGFHDFAANTIVVDK